jgi:hypothetical protein
LSALPPYLRDRNPNDLTTVSARVTGRPERSTNEILTTTFRNDGGKTMSDYVKAWQCIGCGKIEAPQTCIGVCQDRKVEFVYASEHEEVQAQAKRAQQRAIALETLVRQLAVTTPRNGEWERSFRGLQDRARRVLSVLARSEPGD